MFLKLNFTSAKKQYQLWRVVADIVATSGVTSIAALQSRATSAGYASDLLQYLDASNSEIIRTADSSGVSSHVSANTGDGTFEMTLSFPVYDSVGTPYYAQLFNTNASTNNVYFNVGTALTGGTMSSSQIAVSVSDGVSAQNGTTLTLAGTTDGNTTYYHTNAGNTCYTLWVYITNNCFAWFANTSLSTIGWNTSSAASCGPWIIGQYTRYDYFNTMSNGIYPVMYSVPDRGSTGVRVGLQYTDFYTSVANPLYTTNTDTAYCPFRILNTLASVQPSTTAMSWSTSTKVSVAHTTNGVSAGWRAPQSSNNVTTANTSAYLNMASNTTNYKYPNSSLTTPTYIQFPLGWELMVNGCHGGNFSDKTGVYIFNGDFSVGDEYTVGSTTYSIWPLSNPYTSGVSIRTAIGVPKT
jgi:hypothetical protein